VTPSKHYIDWEETEMATKTEAKTGGCWSLRASSTHIWDRIFAHPFLTEVEDGTLPDDKLLYYFIQNVFYIDAAVRFSAEASAKTDDAAARELCFGLFEFGRDELERQKDYVRELAGREPNWEPAPTAFAYTRHLLTLASYGGAEDLIVGLMPCEWTYDEFSHRLAPVVKHPIHQQWLATFAGSEHDELSVRYQQVVNDIVERAWPARRERLGKIFETSSRYEWMFWQMSYTKEWWPV
jgi:thiaminase (transcriptional activator TenA)